MSSIVVSSVHRVMWLFLDPVSVVPSTYFIGESGFPLEIVLGSVDADSLIAKLKKAAEVSQSISIDCNQDNTCTRHDYSAVK